jgi:hypothetical protein
MKPTLVVATLRSRSPLQLRDIYVCDTTIETLKRRHRQVASTINPTCSFTCCFLN